MPGCGNFATAGMGLVDHAAPAKRWLAAQASKGDSVKGSSMLFVRRLFVVSLATLALAAWADEAAIRKNLGERLPNFPAIDEVSKTPIPGIYELRIGAEVLYTDEQGQYVFQGSLIDTKSRANLTEARIAKLTQIDFAEPAAQGRDPHQAGHRRAQAGGVRRPQLRLLQEAGARVAVAEGRVDLHLPLSDPRPRFERQGARYLVLRAIRARSGAAGWSRATRRPRRWAPATARRSSAIWRLGTRSRVSGTPAVVFEDGSRSPGAIPADQLESRIVAAKRP